MGKCAQELCPHWGGDSGCPCAVLGIEPDTCQSDCWTGDDEVYCSLPDGHFGKHDDGEGWEW